MVALGVVGTETNELSVTRGELRLKFGESTELSGTDLMFMLVKDSNHVVLGARGNPTGVKSSG